MNTKHRMGGLLLVVALVAGCGGGGGSSTPDSATPVEQINAVPIANAGAIQNILVGSVVILDGSASDANGDVLTYDWTLAAPTGSAAKLSSNSSAMPTFTADIAGSYVAKLVVNDGKVNSAESSVTVTSTAQNAAPVANAGVGQNVVTGTAVTLDGSASSDADGDQLTFAWSLTEKPAGSQAVLASATSIKAILTADVAGTYMASLIVSDSKVNSSSTNVLIMAVLANAAPMANAGTPQRVTVGTGVGLDASASSDANGDALSYAWTLTSSPSGSLATLSSPSVDKPSFLADTPGVYVATLTASDGKLTSAPATTTVTAVPRITGALGISQGTSFNFCGISGTFNVGSDGASTWTVNNCHVYGTAGSVLWARLQNNSATALQLTRIYVFTGVFGHTWPIGTAGQIISPGETLDFPLPLWLGTEVTTTTATFTITGEQDLTVPLKGSLTLP
jgi:hypothetical protein